MNLLEKIVEDKREEINQLKESLTLEYMKSSASIRRAPPDFCEALRSVPMGLIAEIKRKSPSAGDIRPDLRPDLLAAQYEEGGAQAISLLVDKKYFGGQESDFVMVREAVNIPILYKEFVLDPWQIWHAASIGASAVLLIAAALPDDTLRELLECAEKAGLTPLVEVHTEDEMARAAAAGATCIGINNRDLTTFEVSLETTFRLSDQAPEGCMLISESGIRSAEDISRLHAAGVRGVLVGEYLVRQEDVGRAIRDLMGEIWASS